MTSCHIGTRADLTAFLAADLQASGFERWTLAVRLKRPQLLFQRRMRYCEYWMAKRGPIARALAAFWRLRQARLGQRLGLTIPPGVFGPGLCLPHYGTIVVNDQARFGARTRLHASTNIGMHRGVAPTGGDDIYIGPGAVIYGGITIGDRAYIGANSVVNRDVPDDTTVVGAPARPIALRSRTASPHDL